MSTFTSYISDAVSAAAVYKALCSGVVVMTPSSGYKRRRDEASSVELPTTKRAKEEITTEEDEKQEGRPSEMEKGVIDSGLIGLSEEENEFPQAGDELDETDESDEDDEDDDNDGDSDGDDSDDSDDDDNDGENDRRKELIRLLLLKLNENIRKQIHETECFLRDVCSHIDPLQSNPNHQHSFVRPEQRII